MGRWCSLKIGERESEWKNFYPESVALLFEPEDYAPILHEEGWCEHRYVTTCGKAAERLEKHGISLDVLREVHFRFYDITPESYMTKLRYRCENYLSSRRGDTAQPKKLRRMMELILGMYLELLNEDEQFQKVLAYHRRKLTPDGKDAVSARTADDCSTPQGKIDFNRYYLLDFIRHDPYTTALRSGYDSWSGSAAIDNLYFIAMPVYAHNPDQDVEFEFSEFVGQSIPMSDEQAADWLITDQSKLLQRARTTTKLFGSINLPQRETSDSLGQLGQKNLSAQEKGNRLEDIASRLFTEQQGFVVRQKVRRPTTEIDLLVLNRIDDPFWYSLQSPLILVECKNWKNKVEPKDLRDFEIKMLDRRDLCKLGIIISRSGFTKGCYETVARSSRDGHRIILVDNGALKRRFERDVSTAEWLEELILNQC